MVPAAPTHNAVATNPELPVATSAPSRRRRAVRRAPHRVPCSVTIIGAWMRTVAGQTVNLSNAGVSVQIAESLPKGTRVEILIPSLTAEALQVTGVVVHARRVMAGAYEIGIARSSAPERIADA